jgi:SAM-dependent methyltransferase
MSRWARLAGAGGSTGPSATGSDSRRSGTAGSGSGRSPDRSADRYAEWFAELARSGTDVHGEAALCAALLPSGGRVLDAGCGTGRVAIELARRGFDVLGVDLDAGMLDRARRDAPRLSWMHSDLASLDLTGLDPFDLVVAAGNVVPLVAEGTEAQVVNRLARTLKPGGLLLAGFGLNPSHLPLDHAPVSLADYDTWCATAGLGLLKRYATWDAEPYTGGGYAVSLHRRIL